MAEIIQTSQHREEVAATFDVVAILGALPMIILYLTTGKEIFRRIGLVFVVIMFIILFYEIFFLTKKK